MEEILTLRRYLEEHRYDEALQIAVELGEMSKNDKITRIGSYAKILLLHLIKQAAERRSTRSWELSIEEAVDQIAEANDRRNAGGFYLQPEELMEILQSKYLKALKYTASEALEGQFSAQEIAAKVNKEDILQAALQLILEEQHNL